MKIYCWNHPYYLTNWLGTKSNKQNLIFRAYGLEIWVAFYPFVLLSIHFSWPQGMASVSLLPWQHWQGGWFSKALGNTKHTLQLFWQAPDTKGSSTKRRAITDFTEQGLNFVQGIDKTHWPAATWTETIVWFIVRDQTCKLCTDTTPSTANMSSFMLL